MRCSIDSLLIAVRRAVAAAGCAAFVITGNATSAEPEAGAVTARGLERTADDAIAKLVDFLQHPEGGPHPQFQAPLPPNLQGQFPPPAMAPVPFDAHAHVTQQLDQILGKLERLEARLGGPSPQGQPPFAPLPHGGPQQPNAWRGGPGPQFHGRMVPPGHQAPPLGGMPQDELNRRFEEHARDLHRHVEEMARGLGEKLKGAAGGGEELRHMHEKLAKTHEQLQDRFQDIRRRFAEQQERIERLEQEVRRLHEAHGVGHAEGEKRDRKRDEKGAKRRDEEKQGAVPGANATPNVSYEGEESESL